jgi:hypothetical protein
MKNYILGIVIAVLFYACDKPCQDASTGPPSFSIEIIDAVTNENVFTNEAFTQSQLQVTSTNSTLFNYSFISDNNLNILLISPAWEEGTFTTTLKLGADITIPIIAKVKKVSDDCNTNYVIETVTINNYENYFDQENYIYKIKI